VHRFEQLADPFIGSCHDTPSRVRNRKRNTKHTRIELAKRSIVAIDCIDDL